jgi:hypothetical protein
MLSCVEGRARELGVEATAEGVGWQANPGKLYASSE